MSSTISNTQPSAGQVHGHHHHHPGASAASQQSDVFGSDPASATTAGPSGSQSASTAQPGAGLQKFAAELQSILLSAQSGQPTAAGTTANTPATATDPADATDPTTSGQAGPIRHLADRLQDLLSGKQSGAATPINQPQDLQSVLSALQQTLQKSLASYGSQASTTATTTLTA